MKILPNIYNGGQLRDTVNDVVATSRANHRTFTQIDYGVNPLLWITPATPGLMSIGSPVAELLSPIEEFSGLLQGLRTAQPSQSSGKLVFTTTQYMASASPYSFFRTYLLPDGLGNAIGEGIVPTGGIKTDNGYVFGNHGMQKEDIVTTQNASLMYCSLNDTNDTFEKISEIAISNFGAIGSVQGIALDLTDKTLFVACPNDGSGKVYHIGGPDSTVPFGNLIGSFVYADANALTFDSLRDALIIGKSSDKIATWINRDGTTHISGKSLSLPLLANNDHFCFEPSHGEEGRFLASCGANKQPGLMSLFDVKTGAILDRWQIKEITAIEQPIILSANINGMDVLTCFDGNYHRAWPFVNGVVRTRFLSREGFENATKLTFVMAFRATAQASGTSWLFNYGNAVGTGIGFALKLTATNNQIRITTKGQETGTTANDSNVTTGLDLTSAPIIVSCELDFTASTPLLRVYLNGSDNPTSFTLSSLVGGLPKMGFLINSSPTGGNGAAVEFLGAKMVPLINDYTRKKVEGEVAWGGGAQSSLTSLHPFASFQP